MDGTQLNTLASRKMSLLVLLVSASLSGCARDAQIARSEPVPLTEEVAARTASVTAEAEQAFGSEQATEGIVHAVASPVVGKEMFAPLESEPQIALASSSSSAEATNAQPLKTLGANESLDAELADASGIVLVDFYADWCGPCRRQSKILHEVEPQAKSNNARIIKINVDERPEIAKKYNVGSLPTLIALKNGTVVHRKVGLTDKAQLLSILAK